MNLKKSSLLKTFFGTQKAKKRTSENTLKTSPTPCFHFRIISKGFLPLYLLIIRQLLPHMLLSVFRNMENWLFLPVIFEETTF
ncbi:hypothetical protein C7382_10412 [Porphyromonas loveana]|uniref:Uncharacterized protein n=1 Tax=Porphyromonas loveana TaxID=1884669 RepID=A0A2U1FKI1_9PORP|nr:hypothetical protein C7382_10412 [Porphyromonas loveana]